MEILRCSLIFLTLLLAIEAKTLRQSESAKAELEAYIENKKTEINQRYRLHYHVAAPVGWINDPNGFSNYKGEYHLFYQYYPYDSKWGPMHWGHVTSTDLVNWKQLPTALLPEKEQCFSGSAVTQGDNMVLMYTAHEVIDDSTANETQYLAYSSDGIDFTKYEGNPVLPAAPNGSPDFRDPKVWKNGDYWYVILGSKTDDQRGRVLLYRSLDLISWDFLRVLAESNGDMGYMWECPDFFELDGKFVLLMSPQGLAPVGDRYKNTYQTGYIIGSFNYDTFEFVPEIDFQEMDYGHDFYAAQTTEMDGVRYALAWFGMWEVPYPEAEDGWCGAMTIVREISLVGNRIVMRPLKEMEGLRQKSVLSGRFLRHQEISFDQAGELIIKGDLEKKIELVLLGKNGGNVMTIKWDPETKKVIVDRGKGDIRQVEWSPLNSRSWRIFLDASSMELFCGEGEVVFSSRFYPNGGWRVANLSPQVLDIESYQLSRSVPV